MNNQAVKSYTYHMYTAMRCLKEFLLPKSWGSLNGGSSVRGVFWARPDGWSRIRLGYDIPMGTHENPPRPTAPEVLDTHRGDGNKLRGYHWCLGRDLGPSVIKIFSEKELFPRTSGNDLISILALSDRQTDASGVDLCPFSFFAI
jgi:hypothetical protein